MGLKLYHVKLKISCFNRNPSTTLWVQNLLQIALTVSEIFAIFHFPQKFKMATKSCKLSNLKLYYVIAYQKVDGQHI